MQEDQWLACMYQATSNISRDKRHHRTRREMRLGRLTIDNTIRNKKQKAGARHEVKENMGRDKRHPQDTPRNETMMFDIENTIRNKKQKAGARHAGKENMAGLSATSISRIICVFMI